MMFVSHCWRRLTSFPATSLSALYSAVAGIFRGNTGAKEYGVHVGHAIVRKMVTRFSMRQMQYVDQHPPLRSVNTVADVQEQVNFLLNEQSV